MRFFKQNNDKKEAPNYDVEKQGQIGRFRGIEQMPETEGSISEPPNYDVEKQGQIDCEQMPETEGSISEPPN